MTVTSDLMVHGDLREVVHLVMQGAAVNTRPDLVHQMRVAAAELAAARPAAPIAEAVMGALQSLEIDLLGRRVGTRRHGAEHRHALGRHLQPAATQTRGDVGAGRLGRERVDHARDPNEDSGLCPESIGPSLPRRADDARA